MEFPDEIGFVPGAMRKRKSLSLFALICLISSDFLSAGTGLPSPARNDPKEKAAIVTFISAPEQERAVKALIRSVREWGGAYRSSRIYVISTDPKELPGDSLRQKDVEVLALEIDPAVLSYPLALKAFAAAQVEKRVKSTVSTLIWLDPGVIVLDSLEPLGLAGTHDAAVRPVTLANTISLPPQTPPNDYWKPIYEQTGLDFATLPTLETVVDNTKIQPYYNCEVYSFNPDLGLAEEWARLLTGFLKDERYQKDVCTTFLRKLFLHQAVLSAVLTSRIKPDRVKALPLTSGYPFSQHARIPAEKKALRLNDLSVVIFDTTWDQAPGWMKAMPIDEPLKSWLAAVYAEYLEIAPGIFRMEGSCNSYLVTGEDGSVLIDPAGAAVAPEHFESILARSPLKAILLTHAHPDHSDDIAHWRRGKDPFRDEQLHREDLAEPCRPALPGKPEEDRDRIIPISPAADSAVTSSWLKRRKSNFGGTFRRAPAISLQPDPGVAKASRSL